VTVELNAQVRGNTNSVVSEVTTPEVTAQGSGNRTGIDKVVTPEVAQTDARRVDATTTSIVRWNSLARDLVAKTKTNPPAASRIYAILSMAQYRAIEASQGSKISNDKAAVAGASEAVLKAMFPAEAAAVDAVMAEEHPRGRSVIGQGSTRSGKALGEQIAKELMESRKSDGHDAVWTGQVPEPGPSVWRSTAEPPKPPLLPLWGDVKPFFMPEKGSKDRPAPPAPPLAGSPGFQSALAEVRQISDTRTEEQLRIAMFWADNPGTATPPGHWNQIASDYILREKSSPVEAAKILAAVNAAVMDAGVACWESKFVHWLIRPSQADTAIDVPEKLGLPNFPAYVSGHASFSGAAAEVLGHFFPKHAETFSAMADEAAMSRVYGGIHYRFDGTEGVALGKKVARFTIDGMK
jgi:hypothetical protein